LSGIEKILLAANKNMTWLKQYCLIKLSGYNDSWMLTLFNRRAVMLIEAYAFNAGLDIEYEIGD
jgi:hypothetical protein